MLFSITFPIKTSITKTNTSHKTCDSIMKPQQTCKPSVRLLGNVFSSLTIASNNDKTCIPSPNKAASLCPQRKLMQSALNNVSLQQLDEIPCSTSAKIV